MISSLNIYLILSHLIRIRIMAQKLRNKSKNHIEMDIEIVDENENIDKNECNEELETTFTPIQKLEVFFRYLLINYLNN